MDKFNQKLDTIATVLIIIVTVILGAVLIKQFFIIPPPAMPNQNNASSQSQFANNTPLKIDGVDFAAQPKTIVLALQPGCHYCTASAPFYKRLIENAKDKNIKIVAVLPTPVEESQAYLQKLGVDGIEVKESSLGDIQVQGTPTLILADEKGDVIKTWRGQLPAVKEDEVISTALQ